MEVEASVRERRGGCVRLFYAYTMVTCRNAYTLKRVRIRLFECTRVSCMIVLCIQCCRIMGQSIDSYLKDTNVQITRQGNSECLTCLEYEWQHSETSKNGEALNSLRPTSKLLLLQF